MSEEGETKERRWSWAFLMLLNFTLIIRYWIQSKYSKHNFRLPTGVSSNFVYGVLFFGHFQREALHRIVKHHTGKYEHMYRLLYT